MRLAALIAAACLAGTALAADPAPAPAPAAPAPAPEAAATLDAIALDGLRACQSIAEGRAAADAAVIFGFAPVEATFVREVPQGKIEILPPAADRRSCRVQIYALTLDNKVVLDAVSAYLTTPPQSYAPLQSRIGERLGNYASRTSIWASSDSGGLRTLTLYEILANEYYLGPKILMDFIAEHRH
ncbi:hypothetical protein sos41_14580 [Alphaproteobacteria bacterium SO-S41]|nr:hypothetical protein sos41_14580 [Alphaproteobacteria bacterium SO-S41]